MKMLTVKQVAKISGVSVRALHHYDEIGLLKPARIGRNRYRYYGDDELLRLQQILLHRELDIPLERIRSSMIRSSTSAGHWSSSGTSSPGKRGATPNWSGRSTARSPV